jgi:hypothetical protein
VSTPKRPVWHADADPDNANWLYTWANLPTTLADLKQWLKVHGVTPEQFKQSARYQANVGRLPWLKEL